MKYVSLDLETTCLQPAPQNILQLSMVVEDTSHPQGDVKDLPHFTCFVNNGRIEGEAYALGMNGWILDIISGRKPNHLGYPILTGANNSIPTYWCPVRCEEVPTTYWLEHALTFLRQHFPKEKITVAGKNVAGFDMPFLPSELRALFRHKVIDPGPIFLDWDIDDQCPNFEACKKRSGAVDTTVKHDAREDAMDVILLLRHARAKGYGFKG